MNASGTAAALTVLAASLALGSPAYGGRFWFSLDGVGENQPITGTPAEYIDPNNGINPATGRRLGPAKADLSDFQSIEQIWEAYREVVEFYTQFVPVLDNITARSFEENAPTPFLSACVDGRLAYGRDITLDCGPHYNNQLLLVQGATNVGNSIAALASRP